ncbi:MAG: hypothetical protein ACE5HC_03170 [Candidatus Binatia bacterium]
MARTGANGAYLITSDVDERDRPFLIGEKTTDGFFRTRGRLETATARGLAYPLYADMLSREMAKQDLNEPKKFAAKILSEFPYGFEAYNGFPSSP